jgi:hypothetical protein
MTTAGTLKRIGTELKAHSPFTIFGAVLGIAFMYFFKDISKDNAERLFTVFHPLHVLLSAMVTAALFEIHRKAKNFLIILIVGYVGSVGVATLSDCILPYFGQSILGAVIPTHAALHTGDDHDAHDSEVHTEHGPDCEHDHTSSPHLHLGFIEEWYIVNPAALLGIVLAYFWPHTKVSHAGHILISTWASASFMLMNSPEQLTVALVIGMFLALFIAVWVPCCLSDIVFPMMFVRSDGVHVGHHCCVLCGKKDPEDQKETADESGQH